MEAAVQKREASSGLKLQLVVPLEVMLSAAYLYRLMQCCCSSSYHVVDQHPTSQRVLTCYHVHQPLS